eukprot:1291878-Pleurochrysis_carterae.AAC.1
MTPFNGRGSRCASPVRVEPSARGCARLEASEQQIVSCESRRVQRRETLGPLRGSLRTPEHGRRRHARRRHGSVMIPRRLWLLVRHFLADT